MGKDKLKRFRENLLFPHLFQPTFAEVVSAPFALKGKWHSDYFKNNHPITLELGCGRGEYTIDLAQQYRQRNFIGVDIKGARLWYGAKTALQQDLQNVAFIRARIETISAFFDQNEIDEIWITFPDPQLKIRRAKKRLTAPGFLALYHQFLQPSGTIHLKTDSQELFNYTREVIATINAHETIASPNIDLQHNLPPELNIRTRYEQLFRAQGKPITYVAFQLPETLSPEIMGQSPFPQQHNGSPTNR